MAPTIGGTTVPCKKQLGAIVVTVEREGPKPDSNFQCEIVVEGPTMRTAVEECEKAHEIGDLEPGAYRVSAYPAASGSLGYSLKKVMDVTVAANDRKPVTVQLVPNEIVRVEPNTKKTIKRYVNLPENAADAEWGNTVEIKAYLKRPEAMVRVYWEIEEGADNGKYKTGKINGPDHQATFDSCSGIGYSDSDANGVARIKVRLGRFGGNTYRVIAALSPQPSHASAGGKKSDEIQVWRKHFYQTTSMQGSVLPNTDKFRDSFLKVFLESQNYDNVTFTVADPPVPASHVLSKDHCRPAHQFVSGSVSVDTKLCVGDHNVDAFTALYNTPTQNRSPKSHIIVCDYQCDGKNCLTDEIWVTFDASKGADEVRYAKISGTANHLVCVFNPPLQGGALVHAGSWIQEELSGGVWHPVGVDHPVTDDLIEIRKPRQKNSEVVIKRPPGTVDATHRVTLYVTLRAAKGTYLGWATDPHHIVVVSVSPNLMTADDYNDTLNHEIGHLFGQTPTARTAKAPPGGPAPAPAMVDAANGVPAHPFLYQQRGGSGSHCSKDANFTADNTAVPQLDPYAAEQLDANDLHRSGEYDSGKCIMFGIGNAGKREFCEECAMQLKARSLKTFT